MKKTLFILGSALLTLVLSACQTAPQAVSVPDVVKVPITVYCDVDVPPKPPLNFDEQAVPTMSLYDKSALLAAQDENLKGYASQLEGAISGCKAPPGATVVPSASASAAAAIMAK